MTLKIKTGYRLNVAMIVLNEDNKVLFCKRRNTENWQFPQGGVDSVETEEETLFRELEEEIGTSDVTIIRVAKKRVRYHYPLKMLHILHQDGCVFKGLSSCLCK